MIPFRPLRAVLVALAASALCAACDPPDDPVRPSYDPCAPGDQCGLSTTCSPATLTTTDAAASLCTLPCGADVDCPGFDARCVITVLDGGVIVGQCLRACARDSDCRAGTTCHALRLNNRREGVCVVGAAPRACRSSAECAPFEDTCDLRDAGALATDAEVTGACRIDTVDR